MRWRRSVDRVWPERNRMARRRYCQPECHCRPCRNSCRNDPFRPAPRRNRRLGAGAALRARVCRTSCRCRDRRRRRRRLRRWTETGHPTEPPPAGSQRPPRLAPQSNQPPATATQRYHRCPRPRRGGAGVGPLQPALPQRAPASRCPPGRQCPKCRSRAVHRSHSSGDCPPRPNPTQPPSRRRVWSPSRAAAVRATRGSGRPPASPVPL
mmetsp:Transcript_20052/g.65178  ORF Transcript_20052/g.65178 Transcript_20052/m.65178 type:complete len:209 (+) Transcript_20052:659-1285(+)